MMAAVRGQNRRWNRLPAHTQSPPNTQSTEKITRRGLEGFWKSLIQVALSSARERGAGHIQLGHRGQFELSCEHNCIRPARAGRGLARTSNGLRTPRR